MQKSLKSILLFSLFVFMLSTLALSQQNNKQKQKEWVMFKNPIINNYLADPNIIYENGYYYFFATGQVQDHLYIPIYKSKNLCEWQFVGGAVTGGKKTDWNYKHFWAPEVIKINGKFYLYYTASPDYSPKNSANRVGLAVAENIEGPYKNVGVVVPSGAIDGHPVYDNDGKLFIFYTIEQENEKGYKQGQIFVDELITPEKVAGNPIPVITNHSWQEGAFILRSKKDFLLTYSVGNWKDSTYHVRYAISNRLTGPYKELPDTIVKTNAMVRGPGHHSFFKDRNANTWMVYHGWDTGYTARYPRIDRVYLKGNRIKEIEPSYTEQFIKH